MSVCRYVLFVSGLEIGRLDDHPFHRQLLVDLLSGQLGDETLQETVSRITHIVVAGNSLAECTRDRGAGTRAKYLARRTEAGTKDAVAALDTWLAELAAGGVSVDVMPGDYDPSSYALPQQPLHRCMLPRATSLSTLRCVTNPHHFTLDGVDILGTSGQPVADVLKYTTASEGSEDHLRVLERVLVAGHLAPTAPDTLGCTPLAGTEDPLILSQCPHVLFTGNAPKYNSKTWRGVHGQTVLLLTVPRFAETSTCVLVSLKTLDCQTFCVDSVFPSL